MNNTTPKLKAVKRSHQDAWGEGVQTMPTTSEGNSYYKGNSIRWSIVEDDGSEDPLVHHVVKTKREAEAIVAWANDNPQDWNCHDVEMSYDRAMADAARAALR